MMKMVVLMVAVLGLGGCGAHQVRALVIEGSEPEVLVLSASDARFNRPGVAGISVELTVDPASMSPKTVGAALSDSQGQVQVAVDQLGAGFLEYELGVMARATGYRTLWQTVKMPSSNKRLLIVMTPGKDRFQPNQDVLHETYRMGQELLNAN